VFIGGFWRGFRDEHRLPTKTFGLPKHDKSVMIAYSSKEVRAAVGYRGCNEVDDEVDKAAAWWSGLRPLFPTCVDAVLREH
jgi:hypothetical protein